MTALAGVLRFARGPDPGDACARMLAAQRAYATQAAAVWSSEEIALGRALEPLLPEDAYDVQPLRGAGGRLVLVADVRLDNRDELAAALSLSDTSVRQMCDAAIVLAAFERWGEAGLDRLVGDFAVALWDAGRRRLLLARDPFGQRPLHYHRGSGFFAFAGMPKGLHALAEVPARPDAERVAEFLALIPECGPRTFFCEVARVEPGQALITSGADVVTRRWWEPRRRRLRLAGRDDYVEAAREHLDRAVRSRLRGPARIGAHLSGGLDSAGIAATAARLLAPGRLAAFTAVPREGYAGTAPSDRLIDEGPHAAAVAARYPNMEHVLIRSPKRFALADLARSFALFDRPLPNICNMAWLFAINDAARDRGVRVMLNGEMGNFSLSYSGAELLSELFRRGRWLRWLREAGVLAGRGASWGSLLARTIALRDKQSGSFDVLGYAALEPNLAAALDLNARMRARDPAFGRHGRSHDGSTRLWALRHVDPGNFNKGVLAGWRIDLRDPLADRRLVEFCLAVPIDQYFSGGVSRALARRALADRLPALVVDEQRRGDQAADWHEGVTAACDEVAAELAGIEACASAAATLDVPRLRRLVENWPQDGWHRRDVTQLYRGTLLYGLSAGSFLRRAAEPTGADAS